MRTDIVIGANFGDEGKGLVTDFYAAQSGHRALVVRHNSSAQAGHSVTTQDGRRHVFGHIGAGSFAGAATYLSRFYTCNPLLFIKEHKELGTKCVVPPVFVDQRCLVTTPYDMAINQIVEDFRGTHRHGSCGVGYGETIERNQHPEFAFTLADIGDLKRFLQKILAIRQVWLPRRLLALGVDKISEEWQERLNSDDLLTDFIDATGYMMRHTTQVSGLPADGYEHLVFEGAQGLMLDQDHAYFPHVTRSSTGIRNACAVLQEAGIHEAHVTYVTRSYLTRHGAGPFPNELAHMPYDGIVDLTNVTNAYQEHLRFGWLDADILAHTIAQDKTLLPAGMGAQFGLAVTCMDQIAGMAGVVSEERLHRMMPHDFARLLYEKTDSAHCLASFGPMRDDVRFMSLRQAACAG